MIPIKKGEEIDVPKGRDVDLRCRAAHGYPAPSIEWKKESNKLSSKLVARNEAVLTLINIQPVNAGRYVCTAKNMAGTHSADVVITVKCKYLLTKSVIVLSITYFSIYCNFFI